MKKRFFGTFQVLIFVLLYERGTAVCNPPVSCVSAGDWSVAKGYCEKRGGHIYTPDTATKLAYLETLLPNEDLWIGW